jgi:hypothetical protein
MIFIVVRRACQDQETWGTEATSEGRRVRGELLFVFRRTEVAERRVPPPRVVPRLEVPEDRPSHLLAGVPIVLHDELELERRKKSLGHGVVVTVAGRENSWSRRHCRSRPSTTPSSISQTPPTSTLSVGIDDDSRHRTVRSFASALVRQPQLDVRSSDAQVNSSLALFTSAMKPVSRLRPLVRRARRDVTLTMPLVTFTRPVVERRHPDVGRRS